MSTNRQTSECVCVCNYNAERLTIPLGFHIAHWTVGHWTPLDGDFAHFPAAVRFPLPQRIVAMWRRLVQRSLGAFATHANKLSMLTSGKLDMPQGLVVRCELGVGRWVVGDGVAIAMAR